MNGAWYNWVVLEVDGHGDEDGHAGARKSGLSSLWVKHQAQCQSHSKYPVVATATIQGARNVQTY